MKNTILMLASAVAVTASACSSGVNPAAIRNWADANASNYKALVDARTANADTRRNAYRSVASLVCYADTTEGKVDSPACRCHHATSDADADQFCSEFFATLPAPMLPPAPACAPPAPNPTPPG
jgi:hypothetical protein